MQIIWILSFLNIDIEESIVSTAVVFSHITSPTSESIFRNNLAFESFIFPFINYNF